MVALFYCIKYLKGKMMEKRIGRQEPTTCIIYPYQKTGGETACRLYELTGRQVLPWQRSLIYDILAVDEEGTYIHTKFGYEVPRRNGKGEVIIIRELYALAVGEKVLHTAHRTSTSHSAWERICRILDMLGIEYKSIRAKGQEIIDMPNGGHIEFRTRTAKGGLGEGFDLLIIDEAQEYTTEQESTLKYVVSDSRNPQTLMCGTPPTAVSSGTVFKNYRSDVLSGDEKNDENGHGWAEWSVSEISDVRNKDFWYDTNPSLGLTLKEKSVADEIGAEEESEIDFNIQRLGCWIKYNQKSAISKIAWKECEVRMLPKIHGKLVVGVKFNRNGETVSLSIAGKLSEGKIFVETIKRGMMRNGTEWIVRFLQSLGKNAYKVLVDGDNGKQILADAMKEAKLQRPVFMSSNDIKTASQQFEDAIYQKTLVHMEQPALENVVSNCEHRAIGTGGGFGFRALSDAYDISLMESAILAHFGAKEYKQVKQQVGY